MSQEDGVGRGDVGRTIPEGDHVETMSEEDHTTGMSVEDASLSARRILLVRRLADKEVWLIGPLVVLSDDGKVAGLVWGVIVQGLLPSARGFEC
jgi:hypothetical protein